MHFQYRATCLGRPIGPWRRNLPLAREDLIDRELGEYSEYGTFYIIVPGEIETRFAPAHSKAA